MTTFGPAGRFEVLDGPAQQTSLLDSKPPRRLIHRLTDRPAAFKAAAEILRAEGASLEVVERTQTGERF